MIFIFAFIFLGFAIGVSLVVTSLIQKGRDGTRRTSERHT
jgi:hypothetical protein